MQAQDLHTGFSIAFSVKPSYQILWIYTVLISNFSLCFFSSSYSTIFNRQYTLLSLCIVLKISCLLILLFVCLFVYLCAHTGLPLCACGSQRTTGRCQVSPSSVWIPGTNLTVGGNILRQLFLRCIKKLIKLKFMRDQAVFFWD